MDKTSVFITLFSAVFLCVSAVPRPEKYTNKYDNINVKEILESERLLKNYFACLMDKGPCTPEGSELRRNVPEALQTECKKCTKFQKDRSDEIICWLFKKRNDLFKDLAEKYDPEKIYRGQHDLNADCAKRRY